MSLSFYRLIAVFCLVTLVGWGCTKSMQKSETEPVGTTGNTPVDVGVETPSTTVDASAVSPVEPAKNTFNALRKVTGNVPEAKTVKSPETYQKALSIYQYRLQFLNCQANPSSLTLKSGLPIMLDNRDSQKRTFKLGKQSFSVLGYDYVIAKAPTPGTYTIICDGGGAAELLVQG